MILPQTEKVTLLLEDAGLLPPEMLTLMITDICNLRCRHCWLDCGTDANDAAGPVPVAVVSRIIEDFAKLGGTALTLTGGEVLTHPDWFKILAFACSQRTLTSVCLQTNAVLVTREIATALGTIADMKFSIQVSIDGASAKSHDRVRGNGSFDMAMRGLHRLVVGNMGPRIQVAFTEMRHNISEIGRLMEILEPLNIRKLVSGTLVKGGRARRSDRLALPVPSQYVEIINRYRSDTAFRTLYDRMGKMPAIEWYKGKSTPTERVCSCIKTPFITAEGRMYPCVMLLADAYGIAGVLQRPMPDVLLEALPLWAELPQIEQRRRKMLKTCSDCPGKAHCAGGCMGRAHANSGKLMEVEDRCALRRAVYALNKLPERRSGIN